MKLIFALLLGLSVNTATYAGTAKFVSDLNPIPVDRAGVKDLCSEFIRFDDQYYFCARSENGLGLWKSDGTENGTSMVSEQFAPEMQALFNQQLFFVDQSTSALFKSDGTEAGTALVKDFSRATLLAQLNGKLLLAASDGVTGLELWVSDGSSDGTVMLRDIVPGQVGFAFDFDASDIVQIDNKVFFTINDRSNGEELWVTEGTPETTLLVKDINSGSFSSNISSLTKYESRLVFIATDGSGPELWISDGTNAGTSKLSNFGPGGASLLLCGESKTTVHNGLLLFCFNGDIWASDGTVSGTVEYKNLGSNNFDSFLISADENLFFTVDTLGYSSLNLWVTDGTAVGTKALTNTESVSLKEIHALSASSGEMRFIAELNDAGVSLWRTDSVNESVTWIKDFDTQIGAFTNFPNSFTESETRLLGASDSHDYFILDVERNTPTSLWKTDGTELGTTFVGEFPTDAESSSPEKTRIDFFYTLENDVFFAADDPNASKVQRIWKDTDVGVEILKKITPFDSIATRATRMSEAVVYQDHFYYLTANAPNSFNGMSLWRSDGTASGTNLVKELCETSCRFRFEDAEIEATSAGVFILILNESLWFSDGTSEGTNFVKNVGGDGFGSLSRASKLTALGDNVVFTGWDSATGIELWKSNGTSDGTTIVKDIKPGLGGGFRGGPLSDKLDELTEFAVMNGYVYFVADDGVSGPELWRSNGTELGTELVKDIFPLERIGSYPQDITAVGNTLYFSAFTLSSGYELWKSNGDEASTVLLKDVEPSTFTVTVTRIVCEDLVFMEICFERQVEEQRPYSSLPKGIMPFGDKAVFRAHTLANGYETWITDGTAAGTQLLKDINPGEGGSVDLTIPPQDNDFKEDIDNILRWKESVVAGNHLFFTAKQEAGKIQLWKTDGSSEGTTLVKDIGSTGFSGEQIEQFVLNNNNFNSFFFIVKSSSNGTRLWQSDGERAGTNEFTEQPEPALTEFDNLLFFDDQLLFSATNGIKGLALWSVVPDSDRDGLDDPVDNCQTKANPDQLDFDNDLMGDLCDPDDDNDGVDDIRDAFPFDETETLDSDGDGIGNNADPDDDNDMVDDFDEFGQALDNCPLTANPDQKDRDSNGVGDACDRSDFCFPIKTRSNRVALVCL